MAKVRIETAPVEQAPTPKAPVQPSKEAQAAKPVSKPAMRVVQEEAVASQAAGRAKATPTSSAKSKPQTSQAQKRNADSVRPAKKVAAADAGASGEVGSQGAATVASEDVDGKRQGNVFSAATEWVRKTFPGHEHAFWGGAIALVVALLVFAIGFARVFFIGLVVFVGVAVGQVLDGDPKIIRAIRGLIAGEEQQE